MADNKKKRKIIIVSRHLWNWPFKAGVHYLAEYFIKRGFQLNFLTVGDSLLTIIFSLLSAHSRLRVKHGYKVLLKKGILRIQDQLIWTLSMALFHPSAVLYRYIPLVGNTLLCQMYLKLTFPSISSLLRISGFENVEIAFVDSPFGIPVLEKVNYKTLIYRLADDMEDMRVAKGLIDMEKEVIKVADIVLAVSRPIYEKTIKIKGNTKGVYLVENGVDTKRFQSTDYEMPVEYKAIKSPIAIYVGNTSLIDYELLSYAAKNLPQVSFVIIGQDKHGFIEPNVFFLGPKPHNLIPAYLRFADVGLIPFKQHIKRLASVERPLKFYQYIASGLPVVSTNFGKARSMKPYAEVVDNKKEFVNAINRALRKSVEYRKQLIKASKGFSWEVIYTKLDSILIKKGILGQ